MKHPVCSWFCADHFPCYPQAQAPAASQDKDHISWDDYQQTTYGFVDGAETEEGEAADYKKMIDRDRRRWDAADQASNGVTER